MCISKCQNWLVWINYQWISRTKTQKQVLWGTILELEGLPRSAPGLWEAQGPDTFCLYERQKQFAAEAVCLVKMSFPFSSSNASFPLTVQDPEARHLHSDLLSSLPLKGTWTSWWLILQGTSVPISSPNRLLPFSVSKKNVSLCLNQLLPLPVTTSLHHPVLFSS